MNAISNSRVIDRNSGLEFRQGFSLVELLVVISVIGILVSIAIPAIQGIRESARRTICQKNLRQLALAIPQYEGVHKRYPLGTTGFSQVIPYNDAFTEASPWFWQRVPNTSAIAHLLPMLDHEPLYSRLPIELIRAGLQPDPITWYGELPAVTEVMNVNLPFLVCPSDSLEGGDGAVPIVSSHPCVQFSNLRDWIVYARGFWISDPPGATSYAGCAGVHSGEDQVEPTRVPYRGAMLSTRRMRSSSISDGISHTILFGETLGHIDNFKRIEYHTWLFSGLARGRADLEWGAYEHAINPNFLLLGDSAYSHIAGFGATHPGVIHFSFADGSVHAVNRRIDLWAFYALCGIADGTTAHMLD